MKIIPIVIAISLAGFTSMTMPRALAASADHGNGKNNNSKDPAGQVASLLSSVSVPEIPSKAVGLVSQAKQKDKESVALAAITYVASARPGVVASVVEALSAALPGSAVDFTSTAVKLVPSQALDIANAAQKGAPNWGDKIDQAAGVNRHKNPREVGNPNSGEDRGGRSEQGRGRDKHDHDGDIHGRRPNVPPGHVRDPKPGRDDWRDYGRP